jgi:hypothetical protein
MNGTGARLSARWLFLAALASALAACSENALIGGLGTNAVPTIELVDGPVERDTVGYTVEFSWFGEDRDGRIDHYEFVLCDGDPLGFSREDTTGLDKWTKTTRTDSLFRLTADLYDTTVTVGGASFARYERTHTFFVRAVDDRGARSDPAYRSFTAWTYAPYVTIDLPPNPFPGHSQTLPPIVRFRWTGIDPRDDPWHTAEVDSTRYLITEWAEGQVEDMNEHPERYESKWSPWVAYNAPGDSGVATVVGDDEVLDSRNRYLFAVQAMDEAGAVSSVFDMNTNVRVFAIQRVVGPLLTIKEPYLGVYKFIGTDLRPLAFSLPAGFSFNFSWSADASSYGGLISEYRYGWDLTDLNDPNEWEGTPSPYLTAAPPRTFYSGVHTLYIEAIDNNGYISLAQVEITAFRVDMTRNLLWVDDFYSTDFNQVDYSFPTETEHDQFWLAICGRARDFNPDRDVYDTKDQGFAPPSASLMWKYQNIIWTYSSDDRFNAWDDMVRFTPESRVSTQGRPTINFLAYYMASGGHVWTEGRSDRQGGLTAVMYENAQRLPVYLRCEINGPQAGCLGDTSGVESMAYRDYCVSVLDKIVLQPRWSPGMPERVLDVDAMSRGFRDAADSVTRAHPALPTGLRLWDKVTKPGMFFDPMVRGFTFVELYNPAYWMNVIEVSPQSCFHPMYRMKARNSGSPVNNAVIAFWTTKYADVPPPVPGAVSAPSVQFGLPLWFFDRAEVDSIADAVFTEWQIANSQ